MSQRTTMKAHRRKIGPIRTGTTIGRLLVALASLGALVFLTMPAHAAFPGHNGLIVFNRTRPTGPPYGPQIWVMRADGTHQRRLTGGSHPSFSSDGKKIVFRSDRSGNGQIYVMRADGTHKTRLTHNSASEFEPSFSPSGQRIVFGREPANSTHEQIWLMHADGSHQTRLRHDPGIDSGPYYSPSGGEIVFYEVLPSTQTQSFASQIWKMHADGSHPQQLTHYTSSQGGANSPSFSPSGTHIVFSGPNDDFTSGDIYVMGVNGGHKAKLTDDSVNDNSAFFSPNGAKIVFERGTSTGYHIFVMHADGTHRARLTKDSGDDAEPNWGPSANN